MKPLVYVESSVISYLAARPSMDLVSAARQAITHNWWENCRSDYRLAISTLVEQEISEGNQEAADRRLTYVADLELLKITETAVNISKKLLLEKAVPEGSEEDALHIGIATSHGIEYLLTWNFKHINNASMRKKIVMVVESMGHSCPQLCSPEELGGVANDL